MYTNVFKCIQGGISAQQIESFKQIGVKFDKNILHFINSGISSEQILHFTKHKTYFSFAEIEKFIQHGISANQAGEFKNIGIISFAKILTYLKNGLTAQEISAYKSVGLINDEEILKFYNSGITGKQLDSFVQIGYLPWNPYVLKFIEAEIPSEEVLAFKNIGVHREEDILSCVRSEITPDQIDSIINVQKYRNSNQNNFCSLQ
jgi:hypothetical protein